MSSAPFFFVESLHPPLGAEGVRDLRDSLLEKALQAGVTEEQAWKLAAAADELVCNLEEHGNAGSLGLSAELTEGHEPLRLRIRDNGQGFNLVRAAAMAEGPTGRQERGLGLWMVRQATRSLSQERTAAGENETVLEF